MRKTIKEINLEYGSMPAWKLKKISYIFSFSGEIKNIKMDGTGATVEIHENKDLISVRVDQDAIGKTKYLDFKDIKEDTFINIKGRMYKNAKDVLGIKVTHIERRDS